MEVTAVPLLLTVLLLQAERGQSFTLESTSLRIFPSRLQFFEYERISFSCDGLIPTRWRNNEEFIPMCRNSTTTPAVNCTIYNAFETDSGEYWCEAAGQRISAVNISVTGGPVILESPVSPVTEGEAVTLICTEKATLIQHSAGFYKDGVHISMGDNGKIILHNVSKSDEGLYKCAINGAGESPESPLTVINNNPNQEGQVILESPVLPVMEGEAVTLTCRNKTSSSSLPAVFFKDGVFIGTSSTGVLTLHTVYKSHEGLYRCQTSGAGESARTRLSVRELPRESCRCSSHFLNILLLLRTVFTILMVALLLLLIGLLHCQKCRK